MKTINDIHFIQQEIKLLKQNYKIALVPTMGGLHLGHLQLIQKAKTLADIVVVSIFVNPLQFGPNEDFDKYPRSLEADLAKLAALDVAIVFTPEITQIYPDIAQQTKVCVPKISDELCGKSRPQFFYGITTVVNKLLNIIQPDIAIFGQKDYQQLFIIKKMVRDLCIPVEIVGCEIIREPDGLAMSSRNQYLTAEERSLASLLYKTLGEVKDKILAGEIYSHITDEATAHLNQLGFKVDYLEIRNCHTLEAANIADKDLIILAAAMLGKTRLIDNMCVSI